MFVSAKPELPSPKPPTLRETTEFARIAYKLAGLNLKPEKTEFFAQRLSKRLNAAGTPSYGDYLTLLRNESSREERVFFVEALTTHTTSFFREERHFDFLKTKGFDALSRSGAGSNRPLTIWSAASSTGAELYSALISAVEYGHEAGRNLKLAGYGSDISKPILNKARNAVYTEGEISGLSEARRKAFLLRARTGKPLFRIVPGLRNLCQWQLLNLTDEHMSGPRDVDVIFIRNVLIYFDADTQRRVISVLSRSLSAGGFLLTGHSETLANLPDKLSQVNVSVYQKDA